MKTIVYINGFNVYYSCFKGPKNNGHRHCKWLDYRAICERTFPDDEIAVIRYYTARPRDSAEDPSQAARHDAYVRALQTLPGLVAEVGRFHEMKREGILVRPPDNVEPRQTVKVLQEKGTDAQLACQLIADAFGGEFEKAVLLSNDSDFIEPVRFVRQRFGLVVGVISPDVTINRKLKEVASFGWTLDRGLLPACQLPDRVTDQAGRLITRPKEWGVKSQPT